MGSVSLNMVWNSAIRGSNFLQASVRGIHTYATKVTQANLLGATNFSKLNQNLQVSSKKLSVLSNKVSSISSKPAKIVVKSLGVSESSKKLSVLSNKVSSISSKPAKIVVKSLGVSESSKKLSVLSNKVSSISSKPAKIVVKSLGVSESSKKLSSLSEVVDKISHTPVRVNLKSAGISQAKTDLASMAKSSSVILKNSQATKYSNIPTTQAVETIVLKSRKAKAKISPVASTDIFAKLAAASAFVLPFKPAIEFESEMARVKALSNATPLEFNGLVTKAKLLGATTEWKATEVAAGMGLLSSAGFKPKETEDAMPGLLSLATAGKTDLAVTADISSNILSGFGLKADEMGKVADIMAKTITTANVTTEMLGHTMKYAGSAAASFGADLTTVSTLAAKMGDVGIQGSMSGTAIRTMYTRLAAPPKAAEKVMYKLGVDVFGSDKKLKSMIDIIGELNSAMENSSDKEKIGYLKDLFGVEALSGAIAVMKVGRKELLKYQETLKNSEGSAKKIQDIQLATTAGQFKLFGSAMEALSISATTGFLPFVSIVTEGATKLASKIQWFSDTYPQLSGVVIGGTAAFLLGGIAITAFAFAIGMASSGFKKLGIGSALGKIKQYTTATTTATVAQNRYNASLARQKVGGLSGMLGMQPKTPTPMVVPGLNKNIGLLGRLKSSAIGATMALRTIPLALVGNPIGIAVIAMVAGAALVYQNWERVKSFFGGFASGVITSISPIATEIKSIFGSIIASSKAIWTEIKPIFNGIGAIFSPIISFGKQAIKWLGDVTGVSSFVKKDLAGVASVGQKVGLVVGKVFQIALTPVKLLLKFISKVLQQTALAAKKIGSVFGGVTNFVTEKYKSVKSFFGIEDKEKEKPKSIFQLPKTENIFKSSSVNSTVASTQVTKLKSALASQKPANNSNYKSMFQLPKTENEFKSSPLQEPKYHQIQSFNQTTTDITTQQQTSSLQAKNSNVTVGDIHVSVNATDGKIDADSLGDQIRKVMQDQQWEDEQLSHRDAV